MKKRSAVCALALALLMLLCACGGGNTDGSDAEESESQEIGSQESESQEETGGTESSAVESQDESGETESPEKGGESAASEDIANGYATSDVQALIDAGVFSGDMAEMDSYIAAKLYGVEEDSMVDCACYMATNTSVSADEVAVLILNSADAAKSAAEGCEKRVASQIESCTDYCPDQVPRLEKAVILQRGNSVLFAVGDPDKLPQALQDLSLDT